MSAHQEFLSHNQKYSKEEHCPNLPIPPSKKLIIVTCMDSRIDNFQSLGLQLGEAHIVRNAGGSAKDALRSIIISQRLLGTREIALFHHTGCGLLTFTTPQLRDQIKAELGQSNSQGAELLDKMDFLEFNDLESSVKEDVDFLRNHPLVLKDTTVTGWIFRVEDGVIVQVV
ncbi:carbonic anhydrase [Marasmius fiardii PR-910]|nr:carbonic anhydrase [Marasmius fiardii PR-910]